MKILFITSAHNSLSQRMLLELTRRGHAIEIVLAISDEVMLEAVVRYQPQLIIAPMLKKAIPEAIWRKHVCLIVHPGIIGDRGPSSLDWAIATGQKEWGVTVLQAVAEMDAGPIWASHAFPLNRAVSKSSLYHNEVTEAAVKGVLEAVDHFIQGEFVPTPLDYRNPGVKGKLLPTMTQADRRIDWARETSEQIATRIRAADSTPGVLDVINGHEVYLYGAHIEGRLRGPAGQVLAHRDGAILRGTVNGAIWISHAKAKVGPYAGVKLPAYQVLKERLAGIPAAPLAIDALHPAPTFREIRYREHNRVGYLYFDFYNGAMSTDQCRRLVEAYLNARYRPTKVLVLFGGYDYFSNGIHLNVIEAAKSAAQESWANINAIDDLVYEILNTQSQITIAALRGNAGAGGVMMALAADYVYAREGVVLNPHYQGMGGLYGSEYWTYTLPKRVGSAMAAVLTEECKPIDTHWAMDLGLINDRFGHSVEAFEQEIVKRAELLAERNNVWEALLGKHRRLRADESRKPLTAYRKEELDRMWVNFYGRDPSYHEARRRFVFKHANPPAREHVVNPVAANPAAPRKITWSHRLREIMRREAMSA